MVVETKWSAEAWSLEAPNQTLLSHLHRLQGRAGDVRRAIPQLRGEETDVQPVLFVWGGGRSAVQLPAEPVRIGGADVVYGVAAAKVWRSRMAETPVVCGRNEIDQIWARMRAQAAKTDHQDMSEPSPPTLARIYWTAGATVLATVLGLLGGIYATRLPGGAVAGYLFVAVAAAVGVLARRLTVLRYPALGWLTGAGFFAVLLAALQLFG